MKRKNVVDSFVINHTPSSKPITNCVIATNVINLIQTQLNTIFVGTDNVGPITINLSNGETIIGPPQSKFTQNVPSSFGSFLNSSASSLTLGGVWDTIEFFNGNTTTPFKLVLSQTVNKVISSTGYPACANEFISIQALTLGPMNLANFASSFKVIAPLPSVCTLIQRNLKQYIYKMKNSGK
jgi:O-antigen/teichoic acid export membrane protein